MISKYANASDRKQLYPSDSDDLRRRAHIDQRLFFDAGVLFPRIRASTVCIFFAHNVEFTPQIVADGYEAYDHLEAFLANDDYLVGDELSLADLACITSVSQMEIFAPIDSDKYPRLSGWMQRLDSQLPYLKEINGVNLQSVKDAFSQKIKANQNKAAA